MNPELATLHLLFHQVDNAIFQAENCQLVPLTEKEKREYKLKYGEYDFVIGDFGIKQIRNRKDVPYPG